MKITTLTKFPFRKKSAAVNVKSENYKEKAAQNEIAEHHAISLCLVMDGKVDRQPHYARHSVLQIKKPLIYKLN